MFDIINKSQMNENKFNKLIKRIRNARAFNVLYNFYYSRIVNHIYFKFRNKDLGEEVAQEFFAKLLRRKVDYIRNPTSWVYTVCDNIAKDFLTAEKEYNLAYTERETLTPDAAFEKLIYGEYKEKLDSLEEETRKIVVMYSYEGYSLKEISEITGINYSTVRQKYSRGLKKLKNI